MGTKQWSLSFCVWSLLLWRKRDALWVLLYYTIRYWRNWRRGRRFSPPPLPREWMMQFFLIYTKSFLLSSLISSPHCCIDQKKFGGCVYKWKAWFFVKWLSVNKRWHLQLRQNLDSLGLIWAQSSRGIRENHHLRKSLKLALI